MENIFYYMKYFSLTVGPGNPGGPIGATSPSNPIAPWRPLDPCFPGGPGGPYGDDNFLRCIYQWINVNHTERSNPPGLL